MKVWKSIPFLLLGLFWIACSNPNSGKTLHFKHSSTNTGIYLGDTNGSFYSYLGKSGDSIQLSQNPAISIDDFEKLKLDEDFLKRGLCVRFELSNSGKEKYEALTTVHQTELLYFVINGTVLRKKRINEAIETGKGRFIFDTRFFDSLFVWR